MSVLAVNVLDAHSLLSSFGPLGVAVVLFAETGLLIGFFLPGDSLLFAAGILAAAPSTATVHLSLGWVTAGAVLGACAGAQVGYLIGSRVGRPLFDRSHRPRLRGGKERAEHYLARYGYGRAIVLARFVPVVRTVINPMAGVTGVPLRVFTRWQVVGGILWPIGLILAGYALGSRISNIDHYLLPIVGVIVAVSLIPVALEIIRSRRARTQA
jgi:membrane-associated protein